MVGGGALGWVPGRGRGRRGRVVALGQAGGRGRCAVRAREAVFVCTRGARRARTFTSDETAVELPRRAPGPWLAPRPCQRPRRCPAPAPPPPPQPPSRQAGAGAPLPLGPFCPRPSGWSGWVTPNLSAKTPVKETWKSPEPHSKHLSALAPTPGSHSILGVLWLTSTSSLALSAARRAYPAGISHPRNLENWVMR